VTDTAPALTRADLDAMTKDQLLATAQQMGLSPANASMSKGDLYDTVAGALGFVGVDPQATTTKTKDFLGRLLTNPTPGTSQATDFLTRQIQAGDRDYLGRTLV